MGVENRSVVQVVALLLLICLAVTRVKCQKPFLTCRVGCDNDFLTCIQKCSKYLYEDMSKFTACIYLCKHPSASPSASPSPSPFVWLRGKKEKTCLP